MSRRLLQPAIALAVALLILAALAVYGAAGPSDDTNPSSRSAGRLGTLALYTWLGQLGLHVSRISGSFTLTGDNVVIEYDPTVAFSAGDITALDAFVRGGGDLLVAFGPESEDTIGPLLQQFGVTPSEPLQPGTATPAQPFDVAGRVRQVPTSTGFSFLDAPPFVPLLRQAGASVLGAVPAGRGTVYVLGDTEPLSNDGLRHGDSAVLMLALLERAHGGSVAFDEYHHGEGAAAAGGATAIFSGPVGLAAVLAVLLVLLFLALNGRRLGRPVSTADEAAVPSAAAYVHAMGDLFSRSRQQGPIAARYADELKRRIGARTGIDPHLDDGQFVTMLRAARHEQAEAAEHLLRRARTLAATQPTTAQLLQLARDVDAIDAPYAEVAP